LGGPDVTAAYGFQRVAGSFVGQPRQGPARAGAVLLQR